VSCYCRSEKKTLRTESKQEELNFPFKELNGLEWRVTNNEESVEDFPLEVNHQL